MKLRTGQLLTALENLAKWVKMESQWEATRMFSRKEDRLLVITLALCQICSLLLFRNSNSNHIYIRFIFIPLAFLVQNLIPFRFHAAMPINLEIVYIKAVELAFTVILFMVSNMCSTISQFSLKRLCIAFEYFGVFNKCNCHGCARAN